MDHLFLSFFKASGVTEKYYVTVVAEMDTLLFKLTYTHREAIEKAQFSLTFNSLTSLFTSFEWRKKTEKHLMLFIKLY